MSVKRLRFRKTSNLVLLLSLILITGCSQDFSPNSITLVPKCPDCNVILILVDSLRADHVGAYGYRRNTTPNIDRIAEEGILFRNAFAQSPWTKPSTASILTGMYPTIHGAKDTSDVISNETVLLSEMLSEEGYVTAAFITNVFASDLFGFNQGYDHFFYFRENTSLIYPHFRSDELNKELSTYISNLTDISRNFIYIHYMDPHMPYIPKEKKFSSGNTKEFPFKFFHSAEYRKFNESEQIKTKLEIINAYDDEIVFNDKMIGNLVEVMKEKEIYDKSVIIIISDHGEEFLEHGYYGHSRSLYNELLQIPLIIKIPNSKNFETDRLISQVDILPLLFEILNMGPRMNLSGRNIFQEEKNFHYGDVDLYWFMKLSVQNEKEKLIESATRIVLEEDFTWFKEAASFYISNGSTYLDIASFNKDRNITIEINGKVIMEKNINPQKKTIEIKANPFLDNKNADIWQNTVVIKTKDNCTRPIDMGLNDDRRCLGFRIFDSSNINLSQINKIQKDGSEYYRFDNDESSSNQQAGNSTERREFLSRKINEYKQFKTKKSISKSIDERELQTLKALGYIQ